jgi:hypothetical protein
MAEEQAQVDYDESLFPTAEEAAEANAAWGAGQERALKGRPMGSFQANINDAILTKSMSSGRLQIHYEVEITAGESKGTVLHKYDGLGSPEQADISQQQLKRLGVKLEGLTLKKLPAVLLDLKGKGVAITTRQNGEFYNIYFNRLLGEVVGGAEEGAATSGGKKF